MSVKIHGDNSASSCGFATGDGDTGIMPGSDVVDVVTGGTSRIKAENTTTTISNNLKVDGTRTLIGANESVTANFGAAKLQVNNDGDRVASFMYAGANSSGPHVNLVKSRGGTTDLSTRTAVANNDELGRLNFIGDDGADLGCDGAAIIAKIDGSVSSNVMPTELNFNVNNGTQFATERMRLTKTGSLEVYKGTGNTGKTAGQEAFRVGNGANNFRFSVYPDGTTVIGGAGTVTSNNIQLTNDGTIKVASGGGIDFSATANSSGTMSSELFDDYEEGTWTPTTSGATLTVNHARYRKVGSLVYVTCSLDVTVGSGNQAAHLSGLPFTVESSTGNNYVANESRRVNEDPTILYSIGYAASSIANKYVGRQFAGTQIQAQFASSTSTGQPSGSASWQVNISGVRTVIHGWYVANY